MTTTTLNREDFRRRFEQRLSKVKPRTDAAFRFEAGRRPLFLVNSAFYHLFGIDKPLIPEGYYDDPHVMTAFQEQRYYEQICAIDDDFVPYLMPWFGTGVLPSALGSQIEFPDREDPAVNPRHFPIRDEHDIRRMEIPDPDRSGLMPKVLQFIRYMKQNSFLPVGITDCQGPLATANQLMGYDKLFYLMQDNPNAVHELMDKISDALIVWIKKQKEATGEGLNECFGDQQIYVGQNSGVWMSDDDAVLVSPKVYATFVVPYNAKVLSAFDGGIIHYCGNANHQIGNFLHTDGLRGLNVYSLHNISRLAELKARIEGRLVLIACDFTPLEHQQYYRSLLESLSPVGLIVDSQFSPIVGLTRDGKYSIVQRDQLQYRSEVFDYISGLLVN